MSLVAPPRPQALRRAPATGSPRHGVWWLSPVMVTLIVVPAAVLSAVVIGDEAFRQQWRSPKTLTLDQSLLLLTGGLTLALGAALVHAARPPRQRPRRWPAFSPGEVSLLEGASSVLFRVTVVGYMAYAVTAVRSGLGLAEVAAAFGDQGLYSGEIKNMVKPVTGVTTLTQFGIASAVVSSLLLAQGFSPRQLRRLLTVLVLALPRAFLLTERLALLELAVPIVVIAAMRFSGSPRSRAMLALLPAVLAPLVAGLFAAFEYTRSWVFFREESTMSFAQFAVQRLLGYYATSLNNGALELTYNNAPGRWPYETIAAFWTAPGVEDVELYRTLSGQDQAARYQAILETYGNPEFNNSSGLAAPFVDYGFAGGLIYMVGAGIVLGLLYRGFRESSPLGMLIYPVVFLGVVELPRLLSWAGGRVLPAFAALAVVGLILDLPRKRAGEGWS